MPWGKATPIGVLGDHPIRSLTPLTQQHITIIAPSRADPGPEVVSLLNDRGATLAARPGSAGQFQPSALGECEGACVRGTNWTFSCNL
ncbi:hypothetical protein J6590_087132 [Homalodisca vitripennis]|nr:hypothetical protein J6590_087132 [Homalodisca vitripennis]